MKTMKLTLTSDDLKELVFAYVLNELELQEDELDWDLTGFWTVKQGGKEIDISHDGISFELTRKNI